MQIASPRQLQDKLLFESYTHLPDHKSDVLPLCHTQWDYNFTHSALTLQAGCLGHSPVVLSDHTPLDQLCSRPIV